MTICTVPSLKYISGMYSSQAFRYLLFPAKAGAKIRANHEISCMNGSKQSDFMLQLGNDETFSAHCLNFRSTRTCIFHDARKLFSLR
jgi:hypothetical protein